MFRTNSTRSTSNSTSCHLQCTIDIQSAQGITAPTTPVAAQEAGVLNCITAIDATAGFIRNVENDGMQWLPFTYLHSLTCDQCTCVPQMQLCAINGSITIRVGLRPASCHQHDADATNMSGLLLHHMHFPAQVDCSHQRCIDQLLASIPTSVEHSHLHHLSAARGSADGDNTNKTTMTGGTCQSQ